MKIQFPIIAAMSIALLSASASAEMALSQVIFDMRPGEPARQDVEVFNDGSERMYVSADAYQILRPGMASEERVLANPPESSGLLVSPRRLVLAPGERRTIRIAVIGPRSKVDRVYRVAIKPVAGRVTSDRSALNLFVGYDTLVIVRPDNLIDNINATRAGRMLKIVNEGNTAQELFEGRQCDETGLDCRSLPSKRLYPGASWEQVLPFETEVTYKTAIGPDARRRTF